MVTSIVLTGTYNIGISSNKKILTPDGVTIDIKDIPFVRYRFNHYDEDELKFIQENKKKFPCVHIVEVTLDENTADLLDKLTEFDDMIGKLVYVSITDKEVQEGLSEEQLNMLENIADCEYDRIILKDNSESLHGNAVSIIKKQIKDIMGIPVTEIGVCGGPCCFMEGNACLTAVRAREMLAKYSERDDVVVPSANHEGNLEKLEDANSCINKCGCIRYHIYNSDVAAPVSKSSTTKKKTVKVKTEGEEKEVEVKEKKPPKPKKKSYMYVNW